jgi:hypothetical protein
VALHLPVVASGFDLETELTLQMLYRQYVIREISVPYRARPSESASKLNTFRDGWRVLIKILLILRSYKPLTFFGSLAIICELAMLAIVLFALPAQLAAGRNPVILATLSSSLFTIGIFMGAIGLILNSLNFRLLEDMNSLSKQIQDIKTEKK